jgi:uroporphyrinogen-III synthase
MNILFTRALSDVDMQRAAVRGIDCLVHPLIGVKYVGLADVLEQHPDFWAHLDRVKAVVFTSGNGVSGLLGEDVAALDADTQRLVSVLRNKPVYTVGESTGDTIEPFGILARFPDDYNAVSLAEMMVLDGVHTRVMHFCGDVRRPELGQAMQAAGIALEEVVTYHKCGLLEGDSEALERVRLDLGEAAGVVFYSPSAVGEFFLYELDRGFEGKWFAIGQTTAGALRERGLEPLVPRAPMTDVLLDFVSKQYDRDGSWN